MSAAAPTPPPHRSQFAPMNGSSDRGRNGFGSGSPRHFAHIKDLFASARDQVNPKDSISRLLNQASNALQSARTNITFQRPDYALVDYLVAQIILSQIIQNHPQSLSLRDHGSLQSTYSESIKIIKRDRDTIDELQEIIKLDNQKTNISAVADSDVQDAVASTRPISNQTNTYERNSSDLRTSSTRSSVEGYRPTAGLFQDSSRTTSGNTESRGVNKPPVHAKPLNLQGHSIENGNRGSSRVSAGQRDPLVSRFSALRTGGNDSISRRESGQYSYENDTSLDRSPSSVRRRPTVSTRANLAKELPKIPSPTYSPARYSTDIHEPEPQPADRRSIITSNDVASPAPNSALSYQHVHDAYGNSNGNTSSSSSQSQPRRRRNTDSRPMETEIDAQKLYDFLKTFEVLLIDVRSREEFDSGHIFHRNIVCIEPTALRPNKSAEELLESLVIGTDEEYGLFSDRDQFDLAVYFDQSSTNTNFLRPDSQDRPHLRYLHDSLTHFNQEKPLKWPPVLLIGGMDAWIELVGDQSLVTSNTAANRMKDLKSGRPPARRPTSTALPRSGAVRRRHRDYNPVTPEEEQKWRERARSESVSVTLHPIQSVDPESSPDNSNPSSPGYEAFNLRYPDVASVESQILASRPPTRPPPEAPRIIQYPTPPVPTVPSRPAPAAARPSYSGVSERVVAQSPVTTKVAHLPPYIPPKLLRLPRTGLHNFGVTCYMNATIQCLSATTPLTMIFLDGQYKRYIQRDNWKGSKGLMPELYNTLLANLWRSDDNDTIRPINFRKFCARLNREWGYDRQQDAKEFLEFLIDTLHEDFNVNWMRNPLRPLNEAEEHAREQTPPFFASKLEFNRYLHRDSSKLSELFAGQHLSRLQCRVCRNSSTTYETFWSISVEIPPPSRGRVVTIDDCLRSYCSAEMLSGDEVWRCPHCKKEREATKRITITRAPQFLVIHFKRFSASHTERARKVHTPVEFPLHGLDLGPYVLPPPDAPTQDFLQRRFGPESLEAPINMTPPYKYDAYAVMRHIGGTMTSGHYISLVEDKSRGCWREFNDARVSDFRPEQLKPSSRLQNEQAYIVFYQRVY